MTPTKPELWTLIALLSQHKQQKYWNTRADDIRKQLEQGDDPDAGREAPLTMAARIGHLDIVKVLLEYGADVYERSTYRTPLLFAVNHPEIKAYLLNHGAQETFFTAVAQRNADKVGLSVDEDQFAFVRRESRVLVSHDTDFLRFAIHTGYHSGVVYGQKTKRSMGEIIRGLILIDEVLTQEEISGHVEFL